MRITWLLERADELWGGVKVALEDANWLSSRGHQVTVLSRSGPPDWMPLRCRFEQVEDFRPEHLPAADVLIATFWTTVSWAASAGPGKGVPVHLCQGYEGDMPEFGALRDRIEAAYRLPGVQQITIAPHLTELLRQRFGSTPREIPYAIDHDVHFPAADRPANNPLRVGLVGPWQVAWKDIATGIEACRLAHAAGQPIVLVRATNTRPDPAERNLPFPVEWHERVAPARMGDFYRSLDVFLGTSSGAEEGFFLPAVEAMACGVPCVLTDVPCFRGYGDGQYALFVPPKNPAAMAEALVLAGRMVEVRAALRQQGPLLAARFTRQGHGERLEQALLSIAVEGRGASRPALQLVQSDAPSSGTGQPAATDATTAMVADLASRLRNGARQLHDLQQHTRAADLLAAACCLLPDDDALLRDLASERQLGGDFDGALQALDRLAARGQDDAALHQSRGLLLRALGRLMEAAQAFRATLASGARTADNYNSLGVVLYEAGDLGGARRSFERALVLQPDHADARANLGALPAA